jgi:hypothetical protein
MKTIHWGTFCLAGALCLITTGCAMAPVKTIMSPDGRHTAVVMQGGKCRVDVDGKIGAEYDGIGLGNPFFSPDSQHVAYVAFSGGKSLAVIDGKASTSFDLVGSGYPIFSPDSQHVAYPVKSVHQWDPLQPGQQTRDIRDSEGAGTVRGNGWAGKPDSCSGAEWDPLYASCNAVPAKSAVPGESTSDPLHGQRNGHDSSVIHERSGNSPLTACCCQRQREVSNHSESGNGKRGTEKGS